MELRETAGDVGEVMGDIADFVWDLLTDDRFHSVPKFEQDPADYLATHGYTDVSAEDLDRAIESVIHRLPPAPAACVPTVRSAVQTMAQPAVASNQVVAAKVAAVQPQVVNHVTEQRITHVTEQQVTRVTEQRQTVNNNTVNNNTVNNNTLVEGDTVVDNRTITTITAKGDVTFDQKVDNTTTIADKGGVAVSGDVEGSAVNTGLNKGIIAGDDVNANDTIIGDDNIQLNDSTAGAVAGQGDATSITGENVNTGSGDLTDVDAQGDAQVVSGNGNQVTGDTSIEVSDTDGPLNVAAGNDIQQQGLEDKSTNVNDSFNADNSVEDSGNSLVQDSFNLTDTETNNTDVSLSSASFSLQDGDDGLGPQVDGLEDPFSADPFSADNDTDLDN